MASTLPTTLSGDNLGQRHRFFNLYIKQCVEGNISFQDIEVVPEQSAIDRLFKIELANKLKNIDYIIKTLKDDDMLYVSRALKCKWLLERRDVINPKFLEDMLFPQMIMPAVSKMKHWLYINLSDPLSCQEFYQYYKESTFDFAIKFLRHCDNDFALKEFSGLLTKLTPHYLKVFAEKSPEFVKIYFDSLATNSELVERYSQDEEAFYNTTKYILKTGGNLFIDIMEKYHNYHRISKLSPSATDFILRYHKNRFMAKLELYVVHLLHIPTVARRLSVEECQHVVIQLARANYLTYWFSYAEVEPFVKRVSKENRAAFKKRVFVAKDVGERIDECPYEFPTSPVKNTNNDEPHVFDDQEYEPISMIKGIGFPKMLKKRKACYMEEDCMAETCLLKSELQRLFDEFRFTSFEGTLYELKGRISTASSSDRRRDMLLVLVSKSGGRVDSVRALLQLALRLRNEPVHHRASIVRSLVKRACVWRLPEDVWDMIMDYGVGLGLDGTKAEAECHEGLHAVVLRQLLAHGDCEPAVRIAFLNDFSTLSEYKLTVIERVKIGVSLQNLLITSSSSAEPEVSASYLVQLLDVLEKYHVKIESTSVVAAVADLANRDSVLARPLLVRLYDARVGRRALLRQYLEFRHDDASLVNILRHDIEALDTNWLIKLLIDNETRANQFLLKLAIYFNESGSIGEKIKIAIQDKVDKEPNVRLARPLATLSCGESVRSMISKEAKSEEEERKFNAALRANMHRSRPAPDALTLGWRQVGMKAFAVPAMRCRAVQLPQTVQTLLQEGQKRTIRLALALARRTNCLADDFAAAVKIRPLAALRAALLYFRSSGDAADLRVWDFVKDCFHNLDLKGRAGLHYIVKKVKWVPKALKPNYCAYLYLALSKNSDRSVGYVRRELMKYLPEISDDLLDAVLLQVMSNMDKENPESYPAIVIRYLMLSKNIEEYNTRFTNIGEPFLKKISECRVENDELKRTYFRQNVDEIAETLQYNYAFFDIKYQNCLPIIERFLKWMQSFLPKDMYFRRYVKMHAMMLYYKAIRSSIKQNPEIFEDATRKRSEGLDIVGFTFGKYIIQEVVELKSKYFETVIEIYSDAFKDYLDQYVTYGRSKSKFIEAVIKGMLTETVAPEPRLAIHVLIDNRYYLEDKVYNEIHELIIKKEDKAAQFFLYAEVA